MSKPIPRISTRGYYDLDSGKTLKKNKYYLYPKSSFRALYKKPEISIMIHGLRNDKQGAVNKFEIASRRLKKIGYKYPVIGFSYDSNAKGAHLKKTELKALRVGQKIAQKNGRNLSKFIVDFKKINPNCRIKLIGHSLGSQVILSTVENLSKIKEGKGIIESVYFFGASLPSNFQSNQKTRKLLDKVIKKKILNYYSPKDEVLLQAHNENVVKNPLGLHGSSGITISKYSQRKVIPKNHRFVSYSMTLQTFH